MTARRLLSLLLAAGLAAMIFKARAVDVVIDGPVTRTNNNVILDGDDTITINRGGSITVDESSPNTIGGITSFEQNTGIYLRKPTSGAFRLLSENSSSNNTVTNNGNIIASGNSSEGVSVADAVSGANNTLINHGLIRASSGDGFNGARAVLFTPNSTITNNGTIESLGNGARTAISMGAGATTRIINNGLIRANSSNSFNTIQIEGVSGSRGGEINNNARGRILKQGNDGGVIRVAGPVTGFTVNNAGEITASGTGANSKGIHFTHNSANSNHTVNNSGAIATQGNGAQAVLFGREDIINNSTGNRLENTGRITTRGDNASAVQAGNNNTIHNRRGGIIKTAGGRSSGIKLDNDNTITNDGTIETTGRFADGIQVDDGNRITVGKDGKIKTSGFVAHGISVGFRNENNIIINNGEISITGDQSRGITGLLSEITNNGQITTSGSTFATGINASGRGAKKITNNGVIHTQGKGQQNNGITVNNNGEIINNGAITTEGLQSSGIEASNNNTLTLNGRITTSGINSHGVTTGMDTRLAFGPNSRIKTRAANADGLRIAGLAPAQTRLTHPGHIEAGGTGLRLPWVPMFDNSGHILGMNGAGLHFTRVTGPLSLTNTGTIAGRTGIRIDRMGTGADVTIDNAGALRALQGARGTALDFRGQGQDTLRLRAGSTLEGQIRWDGQGDLLRLEALGPTRLTLIDNDAPANQEPTAFTVNTPRGLPVFRSTMTSSTAGEARTTLTLLNPARTDPRTEATQSLWTGALFQSLAQQQRVQQTFQHGAHRRSAHTAPRSALWIRPFGGLQNYRRAGQTPAARYRYGGALAGYGMAASEWQAGAFLGAARSELRSRGQGIEVEGREVFLGAYGQTRWQDLEVSVAVLLGQSRHDTAWRWRDNRVSGGVTRREYAGKHDFISPELGLSTRLNIQGLTLIPELKLRYLGLFNAEARARQADGLSFKPEDRHIGLIRASVGLPLRFPENQYGGRLSGQLRLGAEGRGRLGGDTTEVRSGRDTVRYRAGRDNAVMGFVGAGFEYGVPAMNLSFSADVEAGYDSEAALGVRGQLGFVWGF